MVLARVLSTGTARLERISGNRRKNRGLLGCDFRTIIDTFSQWFSQGHCMPMGPMRKCHARATRTPDTARSSPRPIAHAAPPAPREIRDVHLRTIPPPHPMDIVFAKSHQKTRGPRTPSTNTYCAEGGLATRRLSSRKSSGRLASQKGTAPPRSARRANSSRAASDRARLLYHDRRRRSISSAGSLCGNQSRLRPASAAEAVDRPRMAEAYGFRAARSSLVSSEQPALKAASGEPAGRGLSHPVSHIAGSLPRDSGTASSSRCRTSAAATERLKDSVKPNLGGPHGKAHSLSPSPSPSPSPFPLVLPARTHARQRRSERRVWWRGVGCCGCGCRAGAGAHGKVDATVCGLEHLVRHARRLRTWLGSGLEFGLGFGFRFGTLTLTTPVASAPSTTAT